MSSQELATAKKRVSEARQNFIQSRVELNNARAVLKSIQNAETKAGEQKQTAGMVKSYQGRNK